MKKQIFLVAGIVIVLVLFFGVRQIRSLQTRISQKKKSVEELNAHLENLKRLSASLTLKRLKGGKLREVPFVSEPQVNKVLLEKYLQSVFGQVGLTCEVKVGKEKNSADFPNLAGIREMPLEVGVTNYSSYDQLIILLESLKEYPFLVDLFTIGGKGLNVPGELKLRIKYYLSSGGA